MRFFTRLQTSLSNVDSPKPPIAPVTEPDASTSSQQTAPPTELSTTTAMSEVTLDTTRRSDPAVTNQPDNQAAGESQSYLPSIGSASVLANLISAETLSTKIVKQRKDSLAGSRQKLLEEKFRTLKIRPPKLRKLNESMPDGSRTFGGRGWKPKIGYSSVAKPRSINYTQHGGPPEVPHRPIRLMKASSNENN